MASFVIGKYRYRHGTIEVKTGRDQNIAIKTSSTDNMLEPYYIQIVNKSLSKYQSGKPSDNDYPRWLSSICCCTVRISDWRYHQASNTIIIKWCHKFKILKVKMPYKSSSSTPIIKLNKYNNMSSLKKSSQIYYDRGTNRLRLFLRRSDDKSKWD